MFIKNESLVEQARSSKKLPNFILGMILALIFIFAGQLIGGIFSIPIYYGLNKIPYFAANEDLLLLLINLLSFAFISILVFIRVTKIEKRKISSIGFCRESWFKKYIIGFALGIILMSVVVLILFLLGNVELEKTRAQATGLSSLLPIGIILIGWIIQGGTEEVVTRGWLMNVLGARYNKILGLIISSTFFSLLHLGNDNVNFVAILNIILVGLLFGLYVMKTNNLWGACGMHSAWNFAQGNLFGFEVSGINTSIGSLVDLKLVGSDLVSGGSFGPEAGAVTSVVLLVGILIICFLDKKGKFN